MSEWLKLEVRMPENGQMVKILCKYKLLDNMIVKLDHEVEVKYINCMFRSKSHSYPNVTHWMELPKAPEVKDE